MPSLKEKQRQIYNARAVLITLNTIKLDNYGFKYTLRFKEEFLRRLIAKIGFKKGDIVLDIGCGAGRFLNKLAAAYGAQGVGLDVSERQIELNSKYNPYNNRYSVGDAEKLPFSDSSFDFILCLDVLEHLAHPAACISEAARVLKKGGFALFYCISKKDRYTWHWFLRKATFNKLGVDTGAKGWGDHDRENFLYPEDVIRYCRQSGFETLDVAYIHSFFTLIYDEVIGKFLDFIIRNIKGFSRSDHSEVPSDGINKVHPGTVILSFLNKVIFWPLVVLDMPWAKKGYSNGFFVLVKNNYKEYLSDDSLLNRL